MKAARYSILAAIIVIAGSTGIWFYQANALEDRVEEMAKEVGIEYSELQKGGFPFDIQIRLVNPKLSDGFVNDGKIVATFSLPGQLKRLDLQGRTHIFVPNIESLTASECLLEGNISLQTKEGFEQMGTINVGPFTLNSPAFTSSGEIVAQYAIQRPSRDRQSLEIDIHGKVKKSITPEKPSSANATLTLFDQAAAYVSEQAGVNSFSLKVDFELPNVSHIQKLIDSPLTVLTERLPLFSFTLKDLDTANNFETSNAHAALSINEDEHATVRVHMAVDSSQKYSDALYSALQSAFEKQGLNDFKALITNFKVGTIRLSNDLIFEINKRSLHWNITLRNLGFSCDLFGIALHGNAESGTPHFLGELTLELKNAPRLVETAITLYNYLVPIINLVETEQQALKPLSDVLSAKVVNFLRQLSTKESAASNDLVIRMSNKDDALYIGGITYDDFTTKAQALINEIKQAINLLPPTPNNKNEPQSGS